MGSPPGWLWAITNATAPGSRGARSTSGRAERQDCEISHAFHRLYRDYQPAPPELGNEVVPDVDAIVKGTAMIDLCPFSVVGRHQPFPTP